MTKRKTAAEKAETTQGRPSKYKPEFCDKAEEYLQAHQDAYGERLEVKLPTIDGFAIYLEVTKPTLYDWEKEYPEFSYALGLIRKEQKERCLNNGLSGSYNATIAKLILSSNHGMSEKSTTEVTGQGGKDLIPEPSNTSDLAREIMFMLKQAGEQAAD